MMKLYFLICSIFYSSLSIGSIYQCSSESETPVLVENQIENKNVEYTTKPSQLSANHLSQKIHRRKKTPFLIYYAVDSEEPFMNIAVSFEIEQLQKSCRLSSSVNFLAILNGLYTTKNEIILCKDQTVQRINLEQFPDFDKKLKLKRNNIELGDHTTRDIGMMKYWVRYRSTTNQAFAKFPLAHPDFLYDFLDFAMTEKNLFPTDQYMPFLNLKSHGSKHTVLSGLYNCQIEAKTKNQIEIIKRALNQEEIKKLSNLNISSPSNNDPEGYEDILLKLKLDSSIGSGSNVTEDSNLNGNANLGNSLVGLGANDGLGTKLAFGIYHITLNDVLDDLFNDRNGRILGFVLLESCDTNRDIIFQKAKSKNILGIYSAQYSLWYRNLNWWNILKESHNSTFELVKRLIYETSKIKNIKISE